jgi:hypothetical protein
VLYSGNSRLLFMLVEQCVDGLLDGACIGVVILDHFALLAEVALALLGGVLAWCHIPSGRAW